MQGFYYLKTEHLTADRVHGNILETESLLLFLSLAWPGMAGRNYSLTTSDVPKQTPRTITDHHGPYGGFF